MSNRAKLISGLRPGLLAAFMAVPPENDGLLAAVAARLPPEEARLIARKLRTEDRARSLAARAMLATLLNRREYALARGRDGTCGGICDGFAMLGFMRRTDKGRPYFDMPHAPLFSLSHCGDYAACAMFLKDARGIHGLGIDLEQIRPLDEANYRAAFSPGEMRLIRQSADIPSELIRRWTIKEAVSKALGLGFTIDPARLTDISGLKTAGEGEAAGGGAYGGKNDIAGNGRISHEGRLVEWQHLPGPEGYWLTVALSV